MQDTICHRSLSIVYKSKNEFLNKNTEKKMILEIYLIGVMLFLIKCYFISEKLEEVPTVGLSVSVSIIFAVLWPLVVLRLIYYVLNRKN